MPVKELKTYEKDQLLYRVDGRTSSADSVFLYYVLEALDGLCFYSTLPFEKGQKYRDVRILCTIEMKLWLQEALDGLSSREGGISLEVLREEELFDSGEEPLVV